MALRLYSIALVLVSACSDTSFDGSSKSSNAAATPKTQALAQSPSPTAQAQRVASAASPIVIPGASSLPAAPASAQNLGVNFKVWTSPDSPPAGTPYWIVVQVQLPSTTQNYTLSDLTGSVHGTDKYVQPFGGTGVNQSYYSPASPYDPAIPPMPENFLYSGGNTAQLWIQVPGAASDVKDSITVHSTLLNDQESTSLTFQ